MFFQSECPSTIENNIFYDYTSIGCTINWSVNIDADPLFCEANEGTGTYTLRIDSPAVAANNSLNEDIGALGVECAWGELARNATVSEGTEVAVLRDVVVPTGVTLTLGDGVVFQMDEDDDDAGGDDSEKVELLVESGGALDVNGLSASKVQFVSRKGSPAEGDWYQIRIGAGATATIDSALVQHATYGIRCDTDETSRIAGCALASNETYDLLIGSASGNDLTVSGNSITVGGGSGIFLAGNIGGTTVEYNTISGSGASGYGIEENSTDGETPTYDHNTVSGFTNGGGILCASDALITGNGISSNKWGIYVSDGASSIGETTGGTNNITSNTTGVYTSGSGADPVVRKNFIYSNTYGVQIRSGSDPNLGTDNSTNKGNNNITGSATYCIWNRNTSGTVQAYGNYYGACSGGLPPSCWSGSVDTGTSLCVDPLDVNLEISRVAAPAGLRIIAATPNPMRGSGMIHFSLDEGLGRVGVQVFDVTGRLVRDIGSHEAGRGENAVRWDGLDWTGQMVRSGLYFVRISVEGSSTSATGKVLVSR